MQKNSKNAVYSVHRGDLDKAKVLIDAAKCVFTMDIYLFIYIIYIIYICSRYHGYLCIFYSYVRRRKSFPPATPGGYGSGSGFESEQPTSHDIQFDLLNEQGDGPVPGAAPGRAPHAALRELRGRHGGQSVGGGGLCFWCGAVLCCHVCGPSSDVRLNLSLNSSMHTTAPPKKQTKTPLKRSTPRRSSTGSGAPSTGCPPARTSGSSTRWVNVLVSGCVWAVGWYACGWETAITHHRRRRPTESVFSPLQPTHPFTLTHPFYLN